MNTKLTQNTHCIKVILNYIIKLFLQVLPETDAYRRTRRVIFNKYFIKYIKFIYHFTLTDVIFICIV